MGKDRYRGVRGFIIEGTHTWVMELSLFEIEIDTFLSCLLFFEEALTWDKKKNNYVDQISSILCGRRLMGGSQSIAHAYIYAWSNLLKSAILENTRVKWDSDQGTNQHSTCCLALQCNVYHSGDFAVSTKTCLPIGMWGHYKEIE